MRAAKYDDIAVPLKPGYGVGKSIDSWIRCTSVCCKRAEGSRGSGVASVTQGSVARKDRRLQLVIEPRRYGNVGVNDGVVS